MAAHAAERAASRPGLVPANTPTIPHTSARYRSPRLPFGAGRPCHTLAMAGTPDGARRGGPARVFLGLTEIAGYYRDLRTGLEAHGVAADVVTIFPHAFGYEVDADRDDVARMVARVRRAFPERPAKRTPPVVLREVVVRVVLLA